MFENALPSVFVVLLKVSQTSSFFFVDFLGVGWGLYYVSKAVFKFCVAQASHELVILLQPPKYWVD